jgi:hypothetical protein
LEGRRRVPISIERHRITGVRVQQPVPGFIYQPQGTTETWAVFTSGGTEAYGEVMFKGDAGDRRDGYEIGWAQVQVVETS